MPTNFEGIYAITVKSPMGEQASTLELTLKDGFLVGTQTTRTGDCVPVYDLATDRDSSISWEIDIGSLVSLTLKFEGALDGDKLSGKVKALGLRQAPFSGLRS
jgi:hypothetical protein